MIDKEKCVETSFVSDTDCKSTTKAIAQLQKQVSTYRWSSTFSQMGLLWTRTQHHGHVCIQNIQMNDATVYLLWCKACATDYSHAPLLPLSSLIGRRAEMGGANRTDRKVNKRPSSRATRRFSLSGHLSMWDNSWSSVNLQRVLKQVYFFHRLFHDSLTDVFGLLATLF